MKKIISVIITIILMMSCCVFSADAANDGVIKAGRVSAEHGDEIVIPVSYVNNPGVFVLRVTLFYDQNVVEYKGIEKSSSDVFNYTVNKDEIGKVVVLLDCQSIANMTDDFEICKLTFKVKKDAKAGMSVFDLVCTSGDATALKEENGKFVTASLLPSTSKGAVTVTCKEHTFNVVEDGSSKCLTCGAVQLSGGEIEVDVNQGLPEVDEVTGSEPSGNGNTDNNSDNTENQDTSDKNLKDDKGDKDKNGMSMAFLIPIVAAVVIAVVTIIVVIVNKRKS